MYDITIATYIKHFKNIEAILDKASVWAKEQNMTEADLLASRLALDQFPFVKQIQVMSDQAKASAAALANIANPSFPDEEETIAQLKERIAKTVDFLNSVTKEMIDESTLSSRMIPFKWVPGKAFTAYDYAISYTVPNFYFHYTTAYSILRNLGMPIGKMDFMGSLPLVDYTA